MVSVLPFISTHTQTHTHTHTHTFLRHTHFLRLQETHNALGFPVLFFFFPSCFSVSRVHDLRIVNWYSWFRKSVNILDWGVHMRIDIGIDISISIRPMATKFDKQVYLEELTQMRLIKQVTVTSLIQDHLKN